MPNSWIFDVLDDLGSFARANGMERLAVQIAKAREVATHEVPTATAANRGSISLSRVGHDTGSDTKGVKG